MSDVTVGERTEDKPAVEVDHPWWALVAVLIGMSMIIIDGSIVNVLLPNMVQDIGLTQVDTQWVNSIYSLIFAALLITVGLMADKHGRRLLFILGAIVFIIGSISSGASQGPGWLIGSRAVQAVGASMMLPSTVAVVNVMFSGRQRAMAFGFWGAVFGGAAALGPLLGGWLAQDFSWRWAFYVNIPVAIVSVIMVLKLVPETKGVVTGKLDIVGVVLSAVGLGLLVWGVIEGQQYGWWTAVSDWDVWFLHLDDGGLSVVPISLVIGAILVGLFVLWEFHRRRAGKGMLIDIALFKIRRYAFGNVVALIVALGEFGILFMLPLWMESVHQLDPIQTGMILATLAVGTLTAGGAARHVSVLLGATNVVRVGMVLEIAGIVGIALLMSTDRSPWWLVIPMIVYGLGLGFDSAQLTNVVLEDIPASKSGEASAMTSTFRQVGSAFGAAVLGAVLFSSLSNIFANDLDADNRIPEGEKAGLIEAIDVTAGQYILVMDQQVGQNPALAPAIEDAENAYTTAGQVTAYVAAGFVFLGLVLSYGLPRDRKPEPEPAPEPDSGDLTPAA